MIKIYKSNTKWAGECTSLHLMVCGDTPIDAIDKLCDLIKNFLIKSYHKDKLDKVLDDQE